MINSEENLLFNDLEEMQNKLVDSMNNFVSQKLYRIQWQKDEKYVKLACEQRGCNFKVWYDYNIDKNGKPSSIMRNKIKEHQHLKKAHKVSK
jgi:hypothetical protein